MSGLTYSIKSFIDRYYPDFLSDERSAEELENLFTIYTHRSPLTPGCDYLTFLQVLRNLCPEEKKNKVSRRVDMEFLDDPENASCRRDLQFMEEDEEVASITSPPLKRQAAICGSLATKSDISDQIGDDEEQEEDEDEDIFHDHVLRQVADEAYKKGLAVAFCAHCDYTENGHSHVDFTLTDELFSTLLQQSISIVLGKFQTSSVTPTLPQLESGTRENPIDLCKSE